MDSVLINAAVYVQQQVLTTDQAVIVGLPLRSNSA
jgi:hypothetical protein